MRSTTAPLVAGHRAAIAVLLVTGGTALVACSDGHPPTAGSPAASSPAVSAPSGTLVALGDSFASGEGTFRYDPGTDVLDPGAPNRCHRSQLAYPSLVDGYSSRSLACSGAATADLLQRSRFGEPPQLRRLAEVASERDVDVVLVTVGANDAGFVDVVGTCLAAVDCTARVDGLHGRVASAADGLVAVLDEVGRIVPAAAAVVVGYPTRLDDTGCIERLAAAEVAAIERWLAELAAALGAATRTAGAVYVDPTPVFRGHGPCSGEPHLHGIVRGPPLLAPESFHPTVAGHAAIAELVTAHLEEEAARR